jgi:hypothetical protein
MEIQKRFLLNLINSLISHEADTSKLLASIVFRVLLLRSITDHFTQGDSYPRLKIKVNVLLSNIDKYLPDHTASYPNYIFIFTAARISDHNTVRFF